MTKNNFEAEYNTYAGIMKHFDTAKEADDKAGMDAARAEYKAFAETINEKGEGYARTFELYKDARDRGNDYIDFGQVIWDNQVAGLIESLRAYGLEKFTFSSGWSSAVDTAWLFLQNGCRLEGLIEINSSHKEFMKDTYEKAHAYLFSL